MNCRARRNHPATARARNAGTPGFSKSAKPPAKPRAGGSSGSAAIRIQRPGNTLKFLRAPARVGEAVASRTCQVSRLRSKERQDNAVEFSIREIRELDAAMQAPVFHVFGGLTGKD